MRFPPYKNLSPSQPPPFVYSRVFLSSHHCYYNYNIIKNKYFYFRYHCFFFSVRSRTRFFHKSSCFIFQQRSSFLDLTITDPTLKNRTIRFHIVISSLILTRSEKRIRN
ncbi:hypothetical protein RIF29_14208 [Crotalaria pallida]|uniref:Uncharacterized protein n=1 Tax=Crotalaria pallida TaxID=3830 RepID=A0AAN9IDK2_CROPI